MAYRKIKAGLVNANIEQFIGERGNLFFDVDTGSLRLSDGTTPGGISVSGGSGGSYTLPTASTTTKGGVKVDGTTINIVDQTISVGTVPYSSISGRPTAVSAFTNDSGYLTSSSLSSYATQSYVTSRGYITSASLPTAVSQLSNDSGYLTTSGFDLDTIDLDANNKLHATGILPGDSEGFTAIFAGRAAGIAALPNTVIQSQAQVNDYAQNNFQNTFDGNHASTEWVATSPNGDDTNYYIDFGISGASWDGTASNSLYTNAGQRDGWVYVQGGNAGGGNLVLGTSTSGTYTKIIAGDASAGDIEVARFSSTQIKLSKQLTFSDNTTQTTAWTGSVSWDNVTSKPTILTTLNSLDDVTTVGATDGQVLKYNASLNIWQPAADLVGSGGSGIGLADLSASNAAASGGGSLSYNNTSGVFTFTPPDLSTYVTSSSLSSTLSTYATQTYVTTRGYITGAGNAATATKLATARAINGVNFDGTAAITIKAATPNYLTFGTGLIGTTAQYDGSTAVTVNIDQTVALKADVHYIGTTAIALNRASAGQTLTGVSIDGNAATVTNGVYTNGSYANPSWITSLAYSKLTGTPTIFSGSYNDLTNKPTIPTNTSELTNNSGFITAAAIPAQFTFNVAADDSTQRTIGTEETIKFIGAGGITTASDAEGNITITQGTISSLTNGGDTLSLNGANKVDLPGGTAFIFSAANNIALFSDLSSNNYLEIINNTGAILSTDRDFEIRTNTDGTARSWTFTQGGTLFFPDSTAQTTAYSTNTARALFSATNASASGSGGSLAYSGGVFTFTPALNIAGNAATVTNGVYTTGSYANPSWITSLAYSKLTGAPASAQQFTFNVAADDSTQRTISSEETVKFVGAGGITTSSDAEGAITITAGGTTTLGTTVLTIGGTTSGLNGLTSINATLSASSFFATPNETVNLFAGAATVNIGKTTGTIAAQNILTIPDAASSTSNSATNRYLGIGSRGQLFDDGNFHIHANSGALWINSLDSSNIKLGTQYNSGSGSDVEIGKNLYVNSGSVTANATTAFIAGSNAISGVALQMPSEAALRNLTNGSTNMYFDVSIGGSTNGQFQFRSSSSYTNVLTMSPTAVSFNTGAAVTARTPAMARTAFNAALDTEITVDNMRFRINSGVGIFPQVIGNGTSRNLAWTAVAALSGRAISQTGSTGTIVASNAWTSLYTSFGMDAAGDTVTVTLQDKALGAIYRITFVRSDNGTTTGYNIIGERIL